MVPASVTRTAASWSTRDYLTNDSGGDDEAYQLGGKYTLNNFSVFGQYEFDKGLITDVRHRNSRTDQHG